MWSKQNGWHTVESCVQSDGERLDWKGWIKVKKRIGSVLLLCMLLLTGCQKSMEAKETESSSGTLFQAGALEMTAEKQEIREEIKPDNPQGYFNHYKKQKGYYYHLISGTIKNVSEEEIDLDEIKVEAVDAEGNISQAKLVVFNKNKVDFWYQIRGGLDIYFFLFSIVKDKQEPPVEYRIYMDDDGKIEKDQTMFDHCYRYTFELPAIEQSKQEGADSETQ